MSRLATFSSYGCEPWGSLAACGESTAARRGGQRASHLRAGQFQQLLVALSHVRGQLVGHRVCLADGIAQGGGNAGIGSARRLQVLRQPPRKRGLDLRLQRKCVKFACPQT